MAEPGGPVESGGLGEPGGSVESGGPVLRRTLLAVTVYNGRAFTPRALGSAARLAGPHCDVVVLDDCSPDPGWSDDLRTLCANLAVGYYRSPRNLGIPRNFNLAALLCEDGGYASVIIANSDVIFPANLISAMDQVAQVPRAPDAAPIASVMAWTNAASIYSLPNDDADRFVADEPTVDRVSQCLADHFGPQPVDIPVGVGFCLLIPRAAIAAVGLFDPVFGRGYCEEVDWCRRAAERGWTNVLAPNVFVYHMGSGSNRDAGLLRPGEQTVHVNEDIVDRRHPDYRDIVAAWEADGSFAALVATATTMLVRDAARRRGFVLEATWLSRARAGDSAGPGRSFEVRTALADGEPASDGLLTGADPVRFEVEPGPGAPRTDPGGMVAVRGSDGAEAHTDAAIVRATADGFACSVVVGLDGVLASVASFVGTQPSEVRIHAPGSVADRLRADAAFAGLTLRDLARYPELI